MDEFNVDNNKPDEEEDDIYKFSATDLPDYNLGSEIQNEDGENKQNGEDQAFFQENQEGIPRPMTSVKASGYNPNARKSNLSTNVPGVRTVNPLKKRSDDSKEYKAIEMERDVNRLYELSAFECQKGNYMFALEKAKESLKKEIKLCKFQEEINIQEHNIDLTFAVNYNCAQMYYVNGMFTEALEAFKKIVKNKNFIQLGGGRLRVNIGNIFFEQARYSEAIKNLQMALDQIQPADHKDLRSRIFCNIGVAYFKLQKYNEAANNFEQSYDTNGSIQSVYNLILCYYALNSRKNMKKSFVKLLTSKIPGLKDDEDLDDEKNISDELTIYLKEKRREYYDLILKSARLVAEHIESNWEKGYDFLIDKLKAFQLRYENCELANEMEMEKALKYLRNKQFESAITALKAFEKKGKKLQSRAATNLSFIYILEGNLKLAEKYSKLAFEINNYNAKALVNQGICLYLQKKYREAKDYFSRALLAEPDCIAATYNIALCEKIQMNYAEALRTFKRLLTVLPDSIEVIFQIADIHNKMDDIDSANDWYNRLITRVPSDPNALFQLGLLYEKENDEANSFNYLLESHKYYPVNIEVVKKLGFYFVQNDIYEKALKYFERASHIKPKEVEWKLYVGSCLRRIGQFRKAYLCYKKIQKNFPTNLECLKYLIQICGELGLEQEKNMYQEKKLKLEKKLEKKRLKMEKKQMNGEEETHDMLTQQSMISKQKDQEELRRAQEKKKQIKNQQEDEVEKKEPEKEKKNKGEEPEGKYKDVNDKTVNADDIMNDFDDLDGLDLVNTMFE